MDNNVFDQSVTDDIKLTPLAESFLLETAKWGKFISIVGFVIIGFFVVFAFFSNMILGSLASTGSTFFGVFFYIIYAAIYFFPVLYLYKFSTKMTTAINNRDSLLTEESFENLKSLYKYMGILSIISLAFMALGILIGIAGLGSAFM